MIVSGPVAADRVGKACWRACRALEAKDPTCALAVLRQADAALTDYPDPFDATNVATELWNMPVTATTLSSLTRRR